MKNKYKFTVIVITYNTEFERTKRTLDSIINQAFDSFEVIVSDDGSVENNFDKIETYFSDNKFYNYILVSNKKNVGTVKNYMRGLDKSSGKYVKALGAGDYLYDKNTLEKMYVFLEKHKYGLCFGRMKTYRVKDGNVIIGKDYLAPKRIELYINNKTFLSKADMIVCHDWISGASMFGRRDIFTYYNRMLINKVIYTEDIFQLLALGDKRLFKLYDDYVVYYEYGTGISTGTNDKMKEKLRDDRNNAIDLFNKLYKEKLIDRLLIGIERGQNVNLKKFINKILDKSR